MKVYPTTFSSLFHGERVADVAMFAFRMWGIVLCAVDRGGSSDEAGASRDLGGAVELGRSGGQTFKRKITLRAASGSGRRLGEAGDPNGQGLVDGPHAAHGGQAPALARVIQ
eukprot:jgi/Mesvir1/2988/Mv21645-RA.1